MDKIAVIGAGASGLYFALEMWDKTKITIFDANQIIGKKLRLTGNGKANISNTNMDIKYFNSNFVSEAIQQFSPNVLIEKLKKINILTKIDSSGRIYPYNESANLFVNYIVNYLKDKVDFVNKRIESIEELNDYKYIIIATGGVSYNGIFSYNLLNEKVNLRPGLVPIKVDKNIIKGLSGIRFKAKAKLYINDELNYVDEGEIQIKDDALSGILIFQISSIISRKNSNNSYIILDLFDDIKLEELEQIIKNGYLYKLTDSLMGIINDKLLLRIIENNNIRNDIKCDYKKLAYLLKNLKIELNELYPISNSQVTIGGISLDNVNNKNMQYKNTNIYVIGEALDVDGLCGGYNLHFAFASANLCANEIKKCLK